MSHSYKLNSPNYRSNFRNRSNIISLSQNKLVINAPNRFMVNRTWRMQSHNLAVLHCHICIIFLQMSHLHEIPSKQSLKLQPKPLPFWYFHYNLVPFYPSRLNWASIYSWFISADLSHHLRLSALSSSRSSKSTTQGCFRPFIYTPNTRSTWTNDRHHSGKTWPWPNPPRPAFLSV